MLVPEPEGYDIWSEARDLKEYETAVKAGTASIANAAAKRARASIGTPPITNGPIG